MGGSVVRRAPAGGHTPGHCRGLLAVANRVGDRRQVREALGRGGAPPAARHPPELANGGCSAYKWGSSLRPVNPPARVPRKACEPFLVGGGSSGLFAEPAELGPAGSCPPAVRMPVLP